MRRARHTNGDSLELLLDTICNVFGGVVFIAILVSLLTTAKTQFVRDHANEQTRSAQSQQDAEQLRAKIDSIRVALDQIEQTEDDLANPHINQVLAMIDQAQAAEKASRAQVAKMDQWIERFARIDGTTAQRSEKRLEQASKNVRLLQQALEQKRTTHRIQGRLPQRHATNKTQVLFLIQNSRVYWIATERGRAILGQRRKDDVRTKTRGRATIVKPRAGGGFALQDNPDEDRHFKSIVRAMNPEKQFFDLYVKGKSIATFVRFKRAVAAKGFDYNVSPIAADKPLMLGQAESLHTQ